MENSITQIIESAKDMQVKVSVPQAQTLFKYAQLIEKWNKTYNLTSIKSINDIIEAHILDSLSIVNFIKPTSLLDIGSGAGLPSVVLAIMIADLRVVAVDSVGKKCRFMQFVKASLKLSNFEVINNRIENTDIECFEQITSRAFAKIDDNIKLAKHLLCKNGVFLLMKGDNWQSEDCKYTIKHHKLNVTFTSNGRFLLEISV